jgi:alcohol dehydrogenase class IV
MIQLENRQHIGDSLADLPALLEQLGAERVLLVVDRGAARASSAEEVLRDLLAARLAGTFDAFTPNPTSDQALAAAIVATDGGVDTMVAFGGGSCMDVAKVGALAAGDPSRGAELVRGGSTEGVRPLRVVAIPTTSGTGSDATHFSAIYVDGHKISVAHAGMKPAGVILDVALHVAMPRFVAAATGLDAICQATESLWAVAATADSRAHALEAQGLLIPSIVESVNSGGRGARQAMMHGAHRCGRAIDMSKTTAAHALSYELTTRFGIAHGLAVALTMGHVAAFNAGVGEADCTHPGGPSLVKERVDLACMAFGVGAAEMPARMRGLLAELGLPATLGAAGVTRESLAGMAEAADTVRLSNNPRRLSTADAIGILERAY